MNFNSYFVIGETDLGDYTVAIVPMTGDSCIAVDKEGDEALVSLIENSGDVEIERAKIYNVGLMGDTILESMNTFYRDILDNPERCQESVKDFYCAFNYVRLFCPSAPLFGYEEEMVMYLIKISRGSEV